MKVDPDLGSIVIASPDGTETHIFLPLGDYACAEADEVKSIVTTVATAELGEPRETKKESSQEKFGAGIYYRDQTSHIADAYRLDILEEEVYVGAAGVTDQIILAIIAGSASGVAAKVVDALLGQIRKVFTGYDAPAPTSRDADFQKVTRLLQHRFGAFGDIVFSEVGEDGHVVTFTASDSRNKRFDVTLSRENEVLAVRVR